MTRYTFRSKGLGSSSIARSLNPVARSFACLQNQGSWISESLRTASEVLSLSIVNVASAGPWFHATWISGRPANQMALPTRRDANPINGKLVTRRCKALYQWEKMRRIYWLQSDGRRLRCFRVLLSARPSEQQSVRVYFSGSFETVLERTTTCQIN